MVQPKPLTGRTDGFTAIEILFVTAALLTLGSVAVAPLRHTIDSLTTDAAARYVVTRLQRARLEAITRSTNVAVRFTGSGSGYAFAVYVDGNHNGVLAGDIRDGVDWRLGAVEHLPDNFPGVEFGALPGLPPVDAGGTAPGSNPIRLGASGAASFSPLGSSSTGTLFLKGKGNLQLAIRIYGETGKTRILRYDARDRRWNPL